MTSTKKLVGPVDRSMGNIRQLCLFFKELTYDAINKEVKSSHRLLNSKVNRRPYKLHTVSSVDSHSPAWLHFFRLASLAPRSNVQSSSVTYGRIGSSSVLGGRAKYNLERQQLTRKALSYVLIFRPVL